MYIRSLGVVMFFIIFLLYALFNIDAVFVNVWLSCWSNEELVNGTTPGDVRNRYLAVYGVLVVIQGKLSRSKSLSQEQKGCFNQGQIS